jgi:hypothetical protein
MLYLTLPMCDAVYHWPPKENVKNLKDQIGPQAQTSSKLQWHWLLFKNIITLVLFSLLDTFTLFTNQVGYIRVSLMDLRIDYNFKQFRVKDPGKYRPVSFGL